jgi:hypothetical protein
MPKTLVYHDGRNRRSQRIYYHDGYMPDARPENEPREDRAQFMAAHLSKFRTLNFATMTSKPGQRHEPDTVHIGSFFFRFERGVCKRVRHGHPDALATVASIDEQLAELAKRKAALLQEKQAALEDAYDRGRKLRADEIRNATNARPAEKP